MEELGPIFFSSVGESDCECVRLRKCPVSSYNSFLTAANAVGWDPTTAHRLFYILSDSFTDSGIGDWVWSHKNISSSFLTGITTDPRYLSQEEYNRLYAAIVHNIIVMKQQTV